MKDKDVQKYISFAIESTVAALKKNGLIKDFDEVKYADISYMLTDFYNNGASVPRIEQALERIKNDDYYLIIPMYYGKGQKIDAIAKRFGVDTSTIVRNKKRLCLQIYTYLI